ncbi:MAG TPA: acyltransferase [Planctomycetaceae bacterium]|nr:acyltransferase [Planctomycetaceae bacterium]
MRLIQLDLLRCVAVLLVLGRHLTPCPRDTNAVVWAATAVWQRGGWVGVDLFFVLSGFLVSGLLFREDQAGGPVDVGRFLVRRAFKIYPSFWALLLVTVLVGAGQTGGIARRPLLGELLFLQNYLGGLWEHTWSLAVEEHFYLAFAALALALSRLPHRRGATFASIPALFLATAVACLGLRWYQSSTMPHSLNALLFPTHLRIDSLMSGVLVSYWWHSRDLSECRLLKRFPGIVVGVGSLMLLPAFIFPLERTWWLPVFGLTLFYVGSSAILIGCLALRAPQWRATEWLAQIGARSYSIYLWHLPVQVWGLHWLRSAVGGELNWFLYAGCYLGGALVIGILSSRLIEYPLLRVRDRLFPSRRDQGRSGVEALRTSEAQMGIV